MRYGELHPHSAAVAESFWISLRYFNLYRIIVAALFLSVTLIYDDALNLGGYALKQFRAVSGVYLVLGAVFHGVLRNLRDGFNLQLSAHVVSDIVAIVLLMNASGGLRSGLGVMLLIALIGSALVAPRRLTYLYASLAAIALLLEQTHWTLVHDAPTADYLQPGLLSIGCFASAGVTTWLAQRVAANEALARQRGRELETQMRVNQLVIRDMQDGVLVVDHEGRVIQHNPRAQRLLNVDVLRGADIRSVLPVVARNMAEWAVEDSDASPRPTDVELGGRGLRVHLLDTGEAEEFRVLFVEDITRSREQAQQLKLAALGRLTANIAHEIRNPLAAISHAAELLQEGTDARDHGRLGRIIHDNTRRLERIVSDVLQLNRRDRAIVQRVHLNAWLRSFIEEFVVNEGVAPERIVLEVRRDSWILFDREHLRQVVWNLLRNAARYARLEPRSIRIELGGVADQIELHVVDNGPGVDPEYQPQLFEPFCTTDGKGTGLGLYLARELCGANRASLEYVDDGAGGHFLIRALEASRA